MNETQEPSTNGLQAFETLSQFLEQDGWYPQQLEGTHIFRMGYAGTNGQCVCYAQIAVDAEQFMFYVVGPVKTPEDARLRVAEFVARANYGLRIGNFELDFNDGEVRYKSSIDFEEATLTPALIRNAMYPAVQTMDHYLAGLMAVTYGGKTPAEAISEIEGK
ncbi:MAG: YbjN domain-containing protein [Chloroflexi bacterium]|nr:YbjN domain-containing protein [Chloroflexota bacterium]